MLDLCCLVDLESSLGVLSALEVPMALPVPPVKPRHYTLQCPDRGVIPYSESLAASKEARCIADLAMFKGRSFRVGWARDGTLASLNTHAVARTMELSVPLDKLDSLLLGRQPPDTSPAIIQRIRIRPGHTLHSSLSFQASVLALLYM